MNAAVLPPPYGFASSSSERASQDVAMPFTAPPARMGQKRRRIDDSGEYENASPTSWETKDIAPHQGQQYSSAVFEPGVHARYPDPTSSGDTAAPSVSVNGSSEPTQHWQGARVSPYPDVSSYSQQPYFYQQTHPSTYNSPWPPTESTPFSTASNAYPHSTGPPPSDMPYFPLQPQTDDGESEYHATESRDKQMAPGLSSFPYASRNDNALSRSDIPTEDSAFLYEDASMHLKNQSLPILENLATQLIHTIAQASFPRIQEIMQGSDDEEGQAYTTLKNLFDQTRKVYSRDTPFIDAIAIQMFQPAQQETIRKANIATFLSSILGAHDVSFFHLNEFFLETFVPLGHRLLKWQGAVFLELKTQTYISALINSDGSPEAMLDELFPSDLDAQILTRHPDAPSLSPSEQDFIDRSRARRSYLLAEESTEEALKELPKKYQWQDFVREFALSVSKNVDGLLNIPTRSQANASDKKAGAAQAVTEVLSKSGIAGAKNSAASIPAVASREDGGGGGRKAASGASTVRQPWTKPEEEALMSGLEKVNGPHWSQILALYGNGGSVSEVLKDRNQVQLKDKARNLKLWYLKMGKDVPVALKGVTGELGKRGGARARAALGVPDEDESMDVDDVDVDGDGDMDMEGGVERRPSTKSAKTSTKKKSKKGS